MDTISARNEWRAYWPLTLAAMVGYSTIGLQSYALGPFVTHLEIEFGWTRAEVMTGLSVSSLAGVFLNIASGMIADRIGPRPVGLTGIAIKTGAFALLATATGSILNWSLLWFAIALGVVMLQASIWTSAVAARFDKSRGLAMAAALTGAPLAATVLPLLATVLINSFGWRAGFVGVGACWFLITFPVVFLLFKDGRKARKGGRIPASQKVEVGGVTFTQGVRSRAFWCLLISFGAFSFYAMTISANLVPLLTDKGVTAIEAAAIASLMGIAGIVGRLSVGALLDRLSGPAIGAVTQLLPVGGCALLLLDQPGIGSLALASTAFGIATGAEVDVSLYLASRHFGLRSFASLFGAIITFGAMGGTVGPYLGGWFHDKWGNYDGVLIVIMVTMTLGSIAIASIGHPKPHADQ